MLAKIDYITEIAPSKNVACSFVRKNISRQIPANKHILMYS